MQAYGNSCNFPKEQKIEHDDQEQERLKCTDDHRCGLLAPRVFQGLCIQAIPTDEKNIERHYDDSQFYK